MGKDHGVAEPMIDFRPNDIHSVWGRAERPDGTFVRVLFRNADRVAYREFHASGCRMGCLVAGLIRIRPNSTLIYPTPSTPTVEMLELRVGCSSFAIITSVACRLHGICTPHL